jgi:hypothetical protein
MMRGAAFKKLLGWRVLVMGAVLSASICSPVAAAAVVASQTLPPAGADDAIAAENTSNYIKTFTASFAAGPTARAASQLGPMHGDVSLKPAQRALATVNTAGALQVAIASGATIDIAADLLLTSSIAISGITDLVINGNGFKVDGQGSVRCFIIDGASAVTISDLIITNGYVRAHGRCISAKAMGCLLF